jgi:hypothetical protein
MVRLDGGPSANTGHMANGDDKAFIDSNRLGP